MRTGTIALQCVPIKWCRHTHYSCDIRLESDSVIWIPVYAYSGILLIATINPRVSYASCSQRVPIRCIRVICTIPIRAERRQSEHVVESAALIGTVVEI